MCDDPVSLHILAMHLAPLVVANLRHNRLVKLILAHGVGGSVGGGQFGLHNDLSR